MPLRRSGRTTAALEAAISIANRGVRINFVVWRDSEIRMIMDRIRRDYNSSGYRNLSVVTYEYMRKTDPGIKAIFDHRVVEELEWQRTGHRDPDNIKIVLECNGWTREQVIDLEIFDCGVYRFAMAEPLSVTCWSEDEYASDATASMKVVDFVRTNDTKNGLIVFKHTG